MERLKSSNRGGAVSVQCFGSALLVQRSLESSCIKSRAALETLNYACDCYIRPSNRRLHPQPMFSLLGFERSINIVEDLTVLWCYPFGYIRLACHCANNH